MAEQAEQVVDLVNRDPNSINDNVNVVFEDVIAEPESAHSIDCVWINAYKCFTGGKKCCYLTLSTICGLPMALCWGCEFACITFCFVWDAVPCFKSCDLICGCLVKFYNTCIVCCLAPLFETIGLMFSKIVVKQG